MPLGNYFAKKRIKSAIFIKNSQTENSSESRFSVWLYYNIS